MTTVWTCRAGNAPGCLGCGALAEAARRHDEAAARAEGKTDIATWQDYLVARDARAYARDALIRECEEPDTEAT